MNKVHRLWCWKAILLIWLSIVGVGSFNFLIDPYAIYGAFDLFGLTTNRHGATSNSRLHKAALAIRKRPSAAVFGSSRAEVGLSPAHPGWESDSVLNLSLPGAGIEEVRTWFLKVHRHAPLKKVVLGLDFFMFNVDKPDYSGPDLVGNQRWARFRSRWIMPLFTVDALRASFSTLMQQDPIRYPGYRPDGQVSHWFKEKSLRHGGQNRTFQRIEAHAMTGMYFFPPSMEFRFADPQSGADTFEAFGEILQTARRDGIALHLFLSPNHDRMLEVISQLGLWPQYEEWKRRLVGVLQEEAASSPGSTAFTLWDFSGFNSVTSEEVPPPEDSQTRMRYYWEGSHYRSEAGDLVLDRLFGISIPGRSVPEDFGKLLTTGNVEDLLAETRRRQVLWRNRHPADVNQISGLTSSSVIHSPED